MKSKIVFNFPSIKLLYYISSITATGLLPQSPVDIVSVISHTYPNKSSTQWMVTDVGLMFCGAKIEALAIELAIEMEIEMEIELVIELVIELKFESKIELESDLESELEIKLEIKPWTLRPSVPSQIIHLTPKRGTT
jgi:hypothetical protein